jgi:hypothetical protein
MPAGGDLVALEHAGWDALSQGGAAAAAFFGEVLADEVAMLLPGGIVLEDRREAIESMASTPWTSFDLVDEQVRDLAPTCAVVTYRAAAARNGARYHALISSIYVLDRGAWRLAVHQQTPIDRT